MPMTKRLHVIFSGRVQGVGFRFTAEAIAAKMDVKGWVRNLMGGQVEIVAEGSESDLLSFISSIEDHFSSYISDKQISWESPTSEFKDFGIRF